MIRISKTIPASRLHLQSWLPRAYRRDRWPLSSRLVARPSQARPTDVQLRGGTLLC